MSRQAVIAVVLVVVIAVLAWWLWPRSAQEPAPEAAQATPPARSPAAQPVPEPEREPLPPLDASDELARETLGAAGVGEGGLAAVLAQDNLVRRFVAAVAAVARGQSPRAQIGFLQPEEGFRGQVTDDVVIVDPRSFARYDRMVAAIGGLDTDVLLRSYQRQEPLYQSAYEDLGESGRFRTVLLQAIDLLVAAPVPSAPIEIEDQVQKYVYADPELESLAPAQKHLLRLGPDNQRIVQNKLRELRAGFQRMQ